MNPIIFFSDSSSCWSVCVMFVVLILCLTAKEIARCYYKSKIELAQQNSSDARLTAKDIHSHEIAIFNKKIEQLKNEHDNKIKTIKEINTLFAGEANKADLVEVIKKITG